MNDFELAAVDGLTLSAQHRALLRPGELVELGSGKSHRLPRFFYSVPSWADAHKTRVAELLFC